SDADTDTDADSDSDTDTGTGSDTGDPFPDDPCDPDLSDEYAGDHNGLVTDGNVIYNVRAPDDYDASTAYPLVMVYAPAGANANQTESFTGLTANALVAGYIIAYANHVSPSSEANFERAAEVADDIPKRWCIDSDQIFITGHSDGGSLATVLAIYDMLYAIPAGIAPSASGTNEAWFDSVTCPASLPVMIMHSSNDTLFPGHGLDARDFWVDCNACDTEPAEMLSDGCELYNNCTDGVEVRYCEGTGSHGTWPSLNGSMINFFDLF
ncbi:MAG: poly(3-hydroxybutyrate) depolymerase, partial [Deltaproteobacteria bacterium]|nr:poly(3-hydroxybutyrate) depolymerase [Deltaproteobacteria bacterium]